jgi:retron-type reverse transcriptase
VLDCDILDFFDNLPHDWLLKFVQHRVADRRILRLIQKWLKAGVVEEGQWENTEMGKRLNDLPQASRLSENNQAPKCVALCVCPLITAASLAAS